ncbi:hypothetical protein QWZ16_21235 [Vibrio ostreicida]|uniref:Uncharacterized protein n=1 Tax=Vibrio ostreicida TaxID=526588 RepID=A0ABT8BYH9_9VIBR|nr:hypothetical protein [Vibrio ostreicida]MDN3612121.1 hypothetical protein [Vibrio ostreicida]
MAASALAAGAFRSSVIVSIFLSTTKTESIKHSLRERQSVCEQLISGKKGHFVDHQIMRNASTIAKSQKASFLHLMRFPPHKNNQYNRSENAEYLLNSINNKRL